MVYGTLPYVSHESKDSKAWLYCIYILFEKNRPKAGVKPSQTLLPSNLTEARDKTTGKGRFRHQTDTGSFKRTEGNIGEELGKRGGNTVDSDTVVSGIFIADSVDGLLFEEFVTTELQCALQEVTGEGRSGSGQKGAGAFILNDLAETTDQAAVVGDRIELDAGLDAVQAVCMCQSPRCDSVLSLFIELM